MSSSGGDNVEGQFVDCATISTGDKGESHHPRDESVEYIGIIWKEMRRVLPCFPDLTLLRWLGGKVRDPVLGFEPSSSSSSSDSKSESWLDPGLPPELRLNDTIPFFSQVFYLIL